MSNRGRFSYMGAADKVATTPIRKKIPTYKFDFICITN